MTKEELQDRLEKARAAKASAESSARETLELAKLRIEVETAEAEAKLAEAEGKLAEQYDPRDLARIETSFGVVVVHTPARSVYKAFSAIVNGQDKKRKSNVPTDEDQHNLIRECLAFPSYQEFTDLEERVPGLADAVLLAILRLAGVSQEAVGGKS